MYVMAGLIVALLPVLGGAANIRSSRGAPSKWDRWDLLISGWMLVGAGAILVAFGIATQCCRPNVGIF